MAISATDLDALYTRYGFTVEPSTPNLRVYVLRQGYLHGADIVPLDNHVPYAEVQKQYQDGGYATHVKTYESIEQAADRLFAGFFSTQQTAEHLRGYYDQYVQRHTRVLAYSYQYIPCPFSLDGVPVDNRALISTIQRSLQQPGPQLILIEAAAGFGKTCAAYEILSSLVRLPIPINPIFAELSRNRQARVFRYVLLDEIDRSYPSLGSPLVQSEIEFGRIPLIIDGFDELLGKRPSLPAHINSTSEQQFETVESMLDTIGALLVREAKIVLTTRRTAILAGDQFRHWVESRPNPFNVVRIALSEPSIADWIGVTRADHLSRRGVRMDALGNPVLLGFIRNMDEDDFNSCCDNPDRLTREYFRCLLDREQQRQDLRIPPDTQLTIFNHLANAMVEADISADSRSTLAKMIVADSGTILESARSTYSSAERPTVEELADKLTGHAILDRVGRGDDTVGFINDFVFGTLIGDSVLRRPNDEWCASESMFTRAVTAFRVRNTADRSALWGKLKFESDLLEPRVQLIFDLELFGSERRPFADATITDIELRNATLGLCSLFHQCTFVQCAFHSVQFVWSTFRQVGFVNCSFYNCTSRGMPDASIWNRGCKEFGCDILASMTHSSSKNPFDLDGQEKAETTYEILRQFWPEGNARASSCLPLEALRLSVSPKRMSNVDAAVTLLERKGLMQVQNGLVLLNEKRMGEIGTILRSHPKS